LAVEALRCGCEGKFCRHPRLSQGIQIFHSRRKWHRLQILLSIPTQCVCVCVCVCGFSSHHICEVMQALTEKSIHCTCFFHLSSRFFLFHLFISCPILSLLWCVFCFSTSPHQLPPINRRVWHHLPRKKDIKVHWFEL